MSLSHSSLKEYYILIILHTLVLYHVTTGGLGLH